MSEYRTRARKVYERGVAERGNFTPPALPLAVYSYWARHSKNAPARENFCHFWRVVVIWAGLMAVRRGIGRVGDGLASPAGMVTVAVAYLGLAAFLVITAGAVALSLFMVGIPYAALGGAVGTLAVMTLFGDEYDSDREWTWVTKALYAITLPISGAITAFFAACFFVARHWNKNWNKYIGYAVVGIAATTALGCLGFAFVLMVMEGGWISLLWTALIILGIFALAAVFVLSATFISGIRKERKTARHEAETKAWNEYYDKFGYPPPIHEGEPPAFLINLGALFTAIGDIIVFTAQIVRVKKWKICPIVNIEANQEYERIG